MLPIRQKYGKNSQKSNKDKHFIRQLKTPWKMWLYFLTKLPSALFWGFRVKQVNAQMSEVTLPYNWRTQNPFRSIYFAAQAGAAEFSTGILANIARQGQGPISMLILDFQAEFIKKANTATTFVCEDGDKVIIAIEKAVTSGKGQIVNMTSIGRNTEGEIVSKIRITWTFKTK